MNAVPNAADWRDEAAIPGVFVGASPLLISDYDAALLLDTLAPSACTLADERSYAARGLSGDQQEWDCGSHRSFHLAA